MKLSDILSPDRVIAGAALGSKKKVLEDLSRLLSGGTTLASGDIFNSLIGREKLGSTGLGHGVAIPHGRVAGVPQSVGAFMRLKHAIDYDAHDGQPVDLVFGLLVPQQATEEHLKHLAAIAEMFSNEQFCAKLRETTDDKQLHKLITSYTPA
jgi:PTS system nitrogen regulatory IIA component